MQQPTQTNTKETMNENSLHDSVLAIAEKSFIQGAESFRTNTINLINSSLDNPAMENLPAVVVMQILAKMLMIIDIENLKEEV
jgi:hypothetical protein